MRVTPSVCGETEGSFRHGHRGLFADFLTERANLGAFWQKTPLFSGVWPEICYLTVI